MKTEKHTSKWHLGKDVITTDTGNYFEMNDNEIMVHKNLFDPATAMVKVSK